MLQRDLIFDLGMFEGQDTKFYMDKGFRVVALEANPRLCERNTRLYANDIGNGRLTLVSRALWREADIEIPFYINSGWSSVFPDVATREATDAIEVRAQTTTLANLFAQFSVPYYLKCDIEGADDIVCDQLIEQPLKPAFVSVEDYDGHLPGKLAAAGYDRFQIVNQGLLHLTRAPNPPREGKYVDVRFGGELSGLFGHELSASGWSDLETCKRRFDFWRAMHERRVNPVVEYVCRRIGKLTHRGWLVRAGWIDIHATRADTLGA